MTCLCTSRGKKLQDVKLESPWKLHFCAVNQILLTLTHYSCDAPWGAKICLTFLDTSNQHFTLDSICLGCCSTSNVCLAILKIGILLNLHNYFNLHVHLYFRRRRRWRRRGRRRRPHLEIFLGSWQTNISFAPPEGLASPRSGDPSM